MKAKVLIAWKAKVHKYLFLRKGEMKMSYWKKALSIGLATVRWTDAWPVDFLESGFMKELEEKHGIKIEWQVYYDNDWQEQKSLLLASGDLPDAFFGSICLKDTDISQNKDYFL